MKLELLAPAQNKQCAIAAIDYGADAVYIGANLFGARKNAANTIEDIKEIVDYAHKFYVRIYCTVNTILNDDEILRAIDLIKNLYEIGVDGLIIQDMGILELAIQNKLPPIPLYASTQCDNKTLEKVKFFDKLGIKRVILARELSLKEISEICKDTNCEIETFIHGALCVSYSGQCYLSQSIGGRSANRGECAQPCRKKYTLIDSNNKIYAENKHLLSLKDFNASEYIEKLANAGVTSFKIEGRLKDENYIKNVVGFYRQKLDKVSKKSSSGKIFFDFEPNVSKSFNRGFTDYFLDKRGKIYNFDTPKSIGEKVGKIEKVGKNYFVINNHSLHAQDGLYFNSNGCLVNKVEGNKIYPNKMDNIKEGITVFRNLDIEFEKQLKNSKTKRQIVVNVNIKDDEIFAKDEDDNYVSLKIRSSEKAQNQEKIKQTFEKQFKKTGESDFFCNSIQFESKNIPFLPISQINELRRNLFKKLMNERLKNYKREFQKPLNYTDFPLKEYDYRANVLNKYAKLFYQKCNCKITETAIEGGTQSAQKALMTTKHCLKFAFNLCQKPIDLFLIDEKNQRYKLKFDCKDCQMQIFKD
ncbi:MAG: U32 family peptidase [Candidatus Gastranaerophilaceae bacterium]